MRTFGSLVASATLVASAAANAQSLAGLTSRGFGIPTVTAAHAACTDVPTSTEPVVSLRILAGHSPDLHEQFAAGEIVVLTHTTTDGIAPGQQYYIRRLQRSIDGRPPSADELGAIHTAGWLTVMAADEHSSLARIDYACDAARTGDFLEPFTEPTMARASGPEGGLRFDDPARVLFGKDRREAFAAGEIFSMDRGTAQGIAAGTRMVVFRDRQNGGPLVEIGEGHVVTADANSARVLVTRSRDAVKAGDFVMSRSAP